MAPTGSSSHDPDEPRSNRRASRPFFSGPLPSGSQKSSTASAKGDDDPYVEITLDVRDDSVMVRSIKGAKADKSSLSGPIDKPNSLASQLSFRLKQVSRELTRITSSSKLRKFDRKKSGSIRALQGLQFIDKNIDKDESWPEIQKRFHELAVDGVLEKSKFGLCIGMKESAEFADYLFDALARKRRIALPSINERQLREFWEQITDTSFDARLETFFDMVDKDADGRISEEEVKEIITLSAAANNLLKIQENVDEYAALIMEELDPDNRGYIELPNLEMLLLQAPSYSTNLTTESRHLMSQMLSQKLRPTQEFNPIRGFFRKLAYFVEDNWKRIWVVMLWLSICAGLFAWKFIQYRHKAVFGVMGYCVCTAKGGAETLKFNMALILLPVCRNTVTWLRTRTKLGSLVPFDDNINFHKVVALGIVVGTGFHVISHLTCDFPRLLHATDAEYEPMKPLFGDTRPNNYWWFVKGTEGWTGVVMLVLMAVAFTLAQPWFRRNKLKLPSMVKKLTGFNAFWYSHHLFIIVYILFIIHGYFLYITKQWYKKTTWMYLAVPMILYALERLVRAFRSSYESVQILKVSVYPGNVLSLHMTKPQGFRYTSGQYVFVNCSAVSSFQWHPFSITSAPGDDYLSIHIRTRGDWTSKLKDIFAKTCQTPDNFPNDHHQADNKSRTLPRLLLDGPYGAPAQDYKKYDVVLLIGLGIGATPLISIVKDVLNNIKQQKAKANAVEAGTAHLHKNHNNNNNKPFATGRAYFYWVTREQGSFEWFRSVMDEVAAEDDADGVIELHNHCTSVYEEGDARSALIAMLQSLEHAKTGVDIVSGTRIKTHFARPDWRRVFKRVAVNHTGQRIGVFYCGPPALVGELRRLAQDFSRKTDTKFDFHKENF